MKLELQDLDVQAFATTDAASGPAGTVRGHEDAPITFRPIYTCPECNPPREEPDPNR